MSGSGIVIVSANINKKKSELNLCYGAAHNVGVECIGNGTAELLAERVCVKFLNVHHGSKILAREPALALSAIGVLCRAKRLRR